MTRWRDGRMDIQADGQQQKGQDKMCRRRVDGRTDISSCQDLCSLLAPPAVQKRLNFVHLWSCKLFRNRNTNKTLIPRHYAALSWHTPLSLAYTQPHPHTARGTFYRSAVRQELSYRPAPQKGTMGILGPTRWWRLIRWQTINEGQRKKEQKSRMGRALILPWHVASVCVCLQVCVRGTGEITRKRRMLTVSQWAHISHTAPPVDSKPSLCEIIAGRRQKTRRSFFEPLANRKICIQAENKESRNQNRTAALNDHLIFSETWKT